jgi:heme/copper-type cytochrome/quinol oxidase subunit 2
MQADTLVYDSLDERPLPKWLIDQKSGLTTIQPEEIVMKEDHSLNISFIVTATFIILIVFFLTIYFNRRHKNQSS